MARRLALSCLGLAAALVGGCTDEVTCAQQAVETDVACDTSAQCIDAGYQSLTCVDGRCRRVCATDTDCRPSREDLSDEPEMCRDLAAQLENAVCEAQLCQIGCPEAPCAAGEQCVDGRCLLFFEGFEVRENDDFADLQRFGWNGIETELTNPKTVIAFTGLPGCALGDDNCAGVAAEGVRFVAIERSVTQAKGTAETDATCRPCACCLECLLEPEDGPPVQLTSCPNVRPSPLTCPSSTPARCQAVCDQCNACPDADAARIGERLVSCELPPAQKTCPSCLTCDADKAACRDAMCAAECTAEPNGADCARCINEKCLDSQACLSCTVCDDATRCLLSDPDSAECAANVDACEALGVDGCFPAAVTYRRSQLTDLEQGLVSPEIDLSGAEGQVVLQLLHVPYNVGESFRPGIQGQSPDTWPVAPQQVRIELCASGCTVETAWVAGELVTGGAAIVPPVDRRKNGLLLGSQTPLDWLSGQVQVVVPESLRTSTFRFRFVPDIAEDARVGVDAITIRRVR